MAFILNNIEVADSKQGILISEQKYIIDLVKI